MNNPIVVLGEGWRDPTKEQPALPGVYPVIFYYPGEQVDGHQLYPPDTYYGLFTISEIEVIDGVTEIFGCAYRGSGESWSDVQGWLPALPEFPK